MCRCYSLNPSLPPLLSLFDQMERDSQRSGQRWSDCLPQPSGAFWNTGACRFWGPVCCKYIFMQRLCLSFPAYYSNWKTRPSLLLLFFSPQVLFDVLQLHGLQHARPLCPSPSPGVCPSSSSYALNHFYYFLFYKCANLLWGGHWWWQPSCFSKLWNLRGHCLSLMEKGSLQK